MKKFMIILLVFVCVFTLSCAMQKRKLRENVIRLHVVGNSNSEYDQAQKLLVKDAVTNYLNGALKEAGSVKEAKMLLLQNLPMIEEIALAALHGGHKVQVSLTDEIFDTRHYDTFSLPAGVYSSLRISIGEAAGRNWWCVVFPSLCTPATSKDFTDVAAGAGFDDRLTGSLTGKKPYRFRFFFLDCIGRLENLFY